MRVKPARPAPSSQALLELSKQIFDSGGRLTKFEIYGMLREAGAPDCSPEQLRSLCGLMQNRIASRARAVRDAARPMEGRPPSARVAAAVAELRLTAPVRIQELVYEMEIFFEDLHPLDKREIAMLPHRREIARLTRLLQAVAEKDMFPYDIDEEVDSRNADPGSIGLILYCYEDIFGPSRIWRGAPVVRFVAAVIKRIGWDEKTPGAIEQILRRRRKMVEERRKLLRRRNPVATNS